MAITPPDSDGSRKTGAFLAFVPEQNTNEVRRAEDGFFFFLTNSDWQRIRQALVSGSNVFIPPSGKAGASISVEWQKAKAYTSPVTGESYFAEKWTTYHAQGTSPEPKQRVAVSENRVVLLTGEHQLAARITVEDLADYTNRIQDAVDAFFIPQEQRTRRELTIQLALTSEGHRVLFVAVPALSAGLHADLDNRIAEVRPPKVTGPVKLELILSIWAFGSNQ
jgi:hypothetical protein